MRPSFVPVGNGGRDTHHFAQKKEPEHVPRGAERSKTRADPSTKYGDHDKASGAGDERFVRGDVAADEIAGDGTREQRIARKSKNYGEDVAADDDCHGLEH